MERRTVLKAAGVSAAALGLAAATGCGGGSGSGDRTVTIRYSWWGAEERATKINQTIRLFEKKYPEIKVKTDFQTCQSFWEKFQTRASGGNPPDVFQNAVTFLRKYDKRGILLDLKSQVQAGNLSLDHFRAGVTKVGQVDGKQLGGCGRGRRRTREAHRPLRPVRRLRRGPAHRHLRRRTGQVGEGWREFVGDFRAALPGSRLVGLAGRGAVAVARVDVRAVRAGLPGGRRSSARSVCAR